MRTILNVALGAALGFCIIFFAAGPFERYVDSKIETAIAERMGAVVQGVESKTQSDIDVDEVVEQAVSKAVAKVKKEMKTTSKTIVSVPATTQTETQPKTTKSAPADNRQYIEVRSSSRRAQVYIGQPKTEILELLGTPDSFDFGGTSERCTYESGLSDWYILRFSNGKLTKVDKL